MNILLYAENEQVRAGLTSFLSSEGHEVASHGELQTAIEHVGQIRPDLVLATYDGGEETIESLYSVVEEKRCPTFLVIQDSQRSHAITMLDKGVRAYFLEPLNVVELRTHLQRLEDNTVVSARRFTFDVLSSLQDGFLVLSDKLKVLFSNPAAAQFIDGDPDRLQGQLISSFGSPELFDLVESTLSEPTQTKQKFLRLGPKTEVVHVRIATVHDASSKIVGLTVHLKAIDTLNQELWQGYKANWAKTLSCYENKLGTKHVTFARLKASLAALNAMREPNVSDPIPVPVSEMLEIAMRRAKKQAQWEAECKIDMCNNEPRALCHRLTLEALFSQLFHASFAAGGQSLKVIARQVGAELHVEFLDGGAAPTADTDFSFEAPAEGRNEAMSLSIANLLCLHQRGTLSTHPAESGLVLVLPTNL